MADTNTPRPMTEEELVTLLDQQENRAREVSGSKLSRQRARALSFYNGEPYGNERDGKSSFVTREVMDTVEWIMPYLMRTFFGAVDAVEFTPRGPDDIAKAEQETAYVNYQFRDKNSGFMAAYQWIKDGLLQKNGVMKAWWDTEEITTTESYEGLDQADVELLAAEDGVRITRIEEAISGQAADLPMGVVAPPPEITYTVDLTRAETRGRLQLSPVPPEEFTIDRDAKTIDDSRFVQQTTQMTLSELRGMGFSEEKLQNLATDDTSSVASADERLVRYRQDDTDPYSTEGNNDEAALDPAQRLVWVKEAYCRVDYDGDGRTELRKVIRVGSTVLLNEPATEVPFVGWTPIIMSHKFYGMSVADTIMDLQLLQSTLVRNMLDNQYLNNNGRWAVLDGQVNLDDLVTSRPQSYVREMVPGAVRKLDTQQLGPEAFQFLSFVDELRERRTGVSAMTQGIAPEMMNSHTTATQHTLAMSSAQQKLELIARVLAETGFIPLFRLIHGLILRHQDKRDVLKVNGEYVVVNPSEWRSRHEMTVNVGTGNLSPEQRLALMDRVAQVLQMAQAAGANIVTPENARTFTEDYIKIVNRAAAGRYTSPPPPPEPPPPDPQMIKAQMDAQNNQQKLMLQAQAQQETAQYHAAQLQLKQQQEAFDQHMDQMKINLDQEKQAFEEEKFAFERRLAEVEAALEAGQRRPVDIG